MDARVEPRPKTLAAYRWHAQAAMLLDRVAAGVARDQPDILITGFWRSGTTWLQEVLADALNAKTIFEPVAPAASGRPIGAPWLSASALPLQNAWVPLAYSTLEDRERRYLDSVFLGCAPSAFSLHCRRSVLESFRSRTVIKCVRAAFLLPDLVARYKLYGLHIRRHPGAVVASFLGCRWSWSFRDIRFSKLFASDMPPALRDDIERLKRYDDAEEFEKIAAYWAFAEKTIAGFRDPRFMIVEYEPLVMAGKKGFTDLVAFVGGPKTPRLEVDRDSTVTTAERLNVPAIQRVQSWRATVDEAMLKRIDAAIADIWPGAPVRHGAIIRETVTPPVLEPSDALAFAT